MGHESVWVDFNQGLDARLITPEITRMLEWDMDEAHRRVLALRDMGVESFAQPHRDYDGGETTEEQNAFAR